MFFKTLLFAAIIVSTSTAAVIAARDDCHKYVIVSARGTTETQGPSIAFKGMIATTLKNVKGGIEYDVVYPASTADNSTSIGVQDVKNYIHNGLEACPDQKYAVLGYSQGAGVILTAVKDLTGTPAENAIEALLLTGNPYQVANQPTTVNATGGDSTRGDHGDLLYLNPSIGLSQHWVSSGKALNICAEGDNVCTNAGPGLGKAHTQYGRTTSVQKEGAQHLVAQLK
ncbi:Cutinase [Akanthomyces lecanii RCEF 1005]|uniref:Cutinase n=1 Tax=Akanthomyces lecanii RCEF 1005 TaxID=1081108 RepID=A0A168DQ17_CORDF|nr:Cutinase [Akanthomyces lecanii RCEF 1005]